MKTNKPIRKEDVHARKLGEEWLLYDSEREKVHILNPTAEFVWRMCDGSHDIAAIKAKLHGLYDIHDEQQLDNDLRQILEEFDQLGMLQGS
jgi:hypothetical protein